MLAGGDGSENSLLRPRLGGRGPTLPYRYISKALRSLRTLPSCKRYNTSQGERGRIHNCKFLLADALRNGGWAYPGVLAKKSGQFSWQR